MRFLSSAVALLVLGWAFPAAAEVTVKVSGVHLCCGGCSNAVNKAVTGAGAKAKCDNGAGEVTITAADESTAQKALDAMADAGFHGKTNSDSLKIKDDSGAPAGNVQRLELTGIHNCCGACNSDIKKTLKSVEGVQADTAKSKSNELVVEGNFSAAAVIKALYDAGYHVKVKK